VVSALVQPDVDTEGLPLPVCATTSFSRNHLLQFGDFPLPVVVIHRSAVQARGTYTNAKYEPIGVDYDRRNDEAATEAEVAAIPLVGHLAEVAKRLPQWAKGVSTVVLKVPLYAVLNQFQQQRVVFRVSRGGIVGCLFGNAETIEVRTVRQLPSHRDSYSVGVKVDHKIVSASAVVLVLPVVIPDDTYHLTAVLIGLCLVTDALHDVGVNRHFEANRKLKLICVKERLVGQGWASTA
jgi:hypothetical protein